MYYNVDENVITTYLYRESSNDGLIYENKDFHLSIHEVWHKEFPLDHSLHQQKPHAHGFIEIRGILQGESAVELENRKYLLLKAGDFVVFPQSVWHSVLSESSNLIKFGFECNLTPKATETGNLYALLLERLREQKVYHLSKNAAQYMEMLLALFENPGIDYETSLLFLSASMVMDMLNSAAVQLGWLDPYLENRVKKAARYINEKVTARTSAGQVAEVVGLSVRQLDRLFVTELGETVNAVITRSKRQKIRGLLLDSRISLEEIVQIMGYSDMTAFVRSFKRVEGITPRQFRKVMKVHE